MDRNGYAWVVVGMNGEKWCYMLLTGTFARTLDEKQRLAIPKRFRDAIGHPKEVLLYITPGTDGSLALYSEKVFEELISQIHGSDAEQDMRAFNRLFYAQAQCAELDCQGRLRIPPELCELAGLEKEIILLGVRDHMELWDKGRWEAYLDDKRPRFDNLVERAFGAESSESSASVDKLPTTNDALQPPPIKQTEPSNKEGTDQSAKRHPK